MTEERIDLATLKKRIRGLANMTVANGCSESEAMVAAAKLSELLDTHGLSVSDVQADADRGTSADLGEEEFDDGRVQKHEVWMLANAIGALFDCVVWQVKSKQGKRTTSVRMVFYGYGQDAAAASALVGILKEAMEREWQLWRRLHGLSSAQHRSGFMVGMTTRLEERLKEMKAARTKAAAGSTALVVLKSQVVAQGLRERGLRFGTAVQRRSAGDETARAAGRSAADRVSLSAGAGIQNTKRLGG